MTTEEQRKAFPHPLNRRRHKDSVPKWEGAERRDLSIEWPHRLLSRMEIEKEKIAFEHIFKRIYPLANFSFSWGSGYSNRAHWPATYNEQNIRLAWEGWWAAKEAALQSLPTVTEEELINIIFMTGGAGDPYDQAVLGAKALIAKFPHLVSKV